ncbi:MAG: hypothetical protein Q7V43_11015 [Myxococcales bacterium]|nr:hypothetical protein [Myxococcales bacterium]
MAGLVAVLAACVTLPRLASRASHLALVILLAMLPALWACAAAVMASRSRDAANAVHPDEWVRDDDPATLSRLPALGETAPREQEAVTSSSQDETHYHHWSRAEGTFRSGPVTFAFSTHGGDSSSETSVSSHGWTCLSASNPGSVRQYELQMRRAPDGTAVAFDCRLVNCEGGYLANSTPTCRPEIAPLVFRRVHFVRAPVHGSLRAALAGLAASLVLCWLATRWLHRPWRAPAAAAGPPVDLGAGPFRQALLAPEEGGPEQVGLRAFDRAMRARRFAVALVFATALLGSAVVLPTVMLG